MWLKRKKRRVYIHHIPVANGFNRSNRAYVQKSGSTIRFLINCGLLFCLSHSKAARQQMNGENLEFTALNNKVSHYLLDDSLQFLLSLFIFFYQLFLFFKAFTRFLMSLCGLEFMYVISKTRLNVSSTFLFHHVPPLPP